MCKRPLFLSPLQGQGTGLLFLGLPFLGLPFPTKQCISNPRPHKARKAWIWRDIKSQHVNHRGISTVCLRRQRRTPGRAVGRGRALRWASLYVPLVSACSGEGCLVTALCFEYFRRKKKIKRKKNNPNSFQASCFSRT